MGLVSFADSNGISWRVWQVSSPAATAHLMDEGYRNGWIVFEREDETERRRLAQVPSDWSTLSPQQLELLCSVARVVPNRDTPTSQRSITPRPSRADDEGPSGRGVQ